MATAYRTVRLIQISMLASIVLYVVVAEKIPHPHIVPNATMFYAISFVSISIVGAILVVRRTLVLPSEVLLQQKPENSVSLARWKSGYIVTYALCEALALFGFVLQFVGFELGHVWPFYFGGFILILFFGPRVPRPEIG